MSVIERTTSCSGTMPVGNKKILLLPSGFFNLLTSETGISCSLAKCWFLSVEQSFIIRVCKRVTEFPGRTSNVSSGKFAEL